MRLDLFLKASRLIIRRSLSQQLCDAKMVKVNDIAAKSSKEIKAGDQIEIRRGNLVKTVKVLQIPTSKQVARSDTENLVQIIKEHSVNNEFPFL